MQLVHSKMLTVKLIGNVLDCTNSNHTLPQRLAGIQLNTIQKIFYWMKIL